jgi:hypothetical protein
MYTTEEAPGEVRPIVHAFLVWVCDSDLESALTELERKAKLRGATAIVGLRITSTDGSYYVPAETFIGGGTTQKDMGSHGYRVESKSWTVYGTGIRRKGDPAPPLFPPGVGAMSGWDLLQRAREIGYDWPPLKSPE